MISLRGIDEDRDTFSADGIGNANSMNTPNNAGKSLFRRSALERISSPEQLNDTIRVTNPGIWLVVVALFLLIGTFGVWAFLGSIPETVPMNGIAFSLQEPVRSVFSYVRMKTARRLTVGMPVQISPDYAPRDRFGYIHGEIVRIGAEPVSKSDILRRFGGKEYMQDLLPKEGIVVEVEVRMKEAHGTLSWSNRNGEAIVVGNGSDCRLTVITRERKPYELVFQP